MRQERRIGDWICWLLPLFLLSAGAPRGAEPKPTPKPSLGSAAPATLEAYLLKLGYASIPLQRGRQNQLLATTLVEGTRRTLIVDTGWSVTALDPGAARKLKTPAQLGIQFQDEFVSTNAVTNLVLIQELKIDSTRFLNQPAATLSLKARGAGFDGALGGDFLARNRAVLDCAAKRLFVRGSRLPDELRNSLEATLGRSGFKKIELKPRRELVYTCGATLNGSPLELLVDTGATYTLIDEEMARQSGMLWGQTGGSLEGVRRGMRSELYSGRPKAFQIGAVPMLFPGLEIGVSELESWQIGEKGLGIHGLLGAELLAKTSAIVDYDAGLLWVVAPEQPPR